MWGLGDCEWIKKTPSLDFIKFEEHEALRISSTWKLDIQFLPLSILNVLCIRTL